MNKLILTIALIICTLFSSAFSQQLQLSEHQLTYKNEERTSVKVLLEPNPKTVKKAFEDWMKDKYDVNLKGIGFLSNKDVLSAEQVTIPEISNKEMDFYAKVVENNGTTEMNLFASYGYEIHITPEKYPKEYKAINRLASSFLNDWLPIYYENEIESVSERLEDLRDDRTKMQETIADNKKEIEKLIKENEKLNKQLSESGRDEEALSQTLFEQKSKLKIISKSLENIK